MIVLGLFLYLISIVVVFGSGILVMIYGWGIEPVSWAWIIFGNMIGIAISAIIQSAASAILKE